MTPITPAERIVPPSLFLVSGRQESRRRLFAKRPVGTQDWLLIFMENGRGYFCHSEGRWIAGKNEIILIRPGTAHDYGMDEDHGHWKNTWVHFLPRPECLDWLKWPEIAPGLMHLRPEKSPARKILEEMIRLDSLAHTSTPRQQELALNSLERVLLYCDSINPLHREAQRDIRITKAMDLLCQNVETHFNLQELARQCGLSRSHLAELFRREVGTTPLAFLEAQRLRRVREALDHTGLGLAQIAEQTGFSNAFYLSLRFKKAFGCSPRHYRQLKARQKISGRYGKDA